MQETMTEMKLCWCTFP